MNHQEAGLIADIGAAEKDTACMASNPTTCPSFSWTVHLYHCLRRHDDVFEQQCYHLCYDSYLHKVVNVDSFPITGA